MNFLVKKRKKGLVAKLVVDKEERQSPYFTEIEKIFESLEGIIVFHSLSMLENLAERLKRVASNREEFEAISAQLNGPSHGLIPEKEQERLIQRHQEIIELSL